MALNSVLSPEKITGKSNKSVLSAQNFISGGSSLGSSVFGGAANKIVNFQRAGVQPSPTDVGSIIRSISAGVVNNYNNQAQNINNSVTNIISKSISNLSKDYQDRIKKVDEAKPTGILQKILGLYKDVIGFIQFFGNRKFVDKLRDNLKALQTSFTESFEVAQIVRQVIVKIVKQLSNLPKANPSGSSGLNVDVDVPGGGLKKSAPRGLGRMMRRVGGKGRMLALGAGALGLGAAGGAAVNALSGSDNVQPGGAAPEIPGNIVDSLSSIIDRFARAIDSLVKGGSGKTSGSSSGGGGGSAGNVEKPKGTPGDTPGAGSVVSSAPGDEKLGAFVASMEAASPENASDAMQVMLNRSASGKYGKGLSGVLSGYDQFSPISAAIYGKSDDPVAQAKYGPIAAKLPGNTPQEKFKYLQSESSKPDGLNKLQQLFGGGNAGVAATVLNDPKYLAASRKNVKNAQNFYGGRKANASDIQFRPGGNNFYNFTGPVGTLGTQPTGTTPQAQTQAPQAQAQAAQTQAAPQVQAAPQLQTQVAQRAAAVSQPAQTQPQVNYLPIDMGGGQQPQQSGGGGLSVPPSQAKGGPTVPLLSATNTDNFLVLYSRMVYNIVDG